MSDTSQGEGWWMASDGKWYPPQTAATTQPPPPPATAAAGPAPAQGDQPRETATAALVCGIVGLCISWIPFVGFAGLILGIIALVLGFVKRKTHKVKAAMILGTLAIIVSTIVWFAFVAAVDDVVDDIDDCFNAIEFDLEQLLETGIDPDTASAVC
jgi:hypothetical protein